MKAEPPAQAIDRLLDKVYSAPPTAPTFDQQLAGYRYDYPVAALVIDYAPCVLSVALLVWLSSRSPRLRKAIARKRLCLSKRAWIAAGLATFGLLTAYAVRYEYTESRARHVRVNRWTDCTEVFNGSNGWKAMGSTCD